jgi:1-phosphofructokinase
MNRNIITITLNPSIDVTLWTDGLNIDEVNRVVKETREAGGKGINVSRVIKSFGIPTLCMSIIGRENHDEFSDFLKNEQLMYKHIKVDGAVRENLTIRCNGYTLKINRKGPPVSSTVTGELFSLIESCIKPGDIAVFAGSIPENILVEDYIELILAVKQLGALIAVDNDIFSFEQYSRISPWLIKPNIHELRHIVELDGESVDDIANAASKLSANGVENVLVSLGGNGIIYVSKHHALRASVPKVEVKSSVGAGDSALAGFTVSFINNQNIKDCVGLAAACGTASVMQEGTGLATRETAFEILNLVEVKEI